MAAWQDKGGGNNCAGQGFLSDGVAKSRDIPTLMSLLPQYDGVVIQDSYTGWMRIGSNRQMCMAHQIRIAKRDLKYKKLNSETTNFLNDLCAILKGLYGTDKTKGCEKTSGGCRFL